MKATNAFAKNLQDANKNSKQLQKAKENQKAKANDQKIFLSTYLAGKDLENNKDGGGEIDGGDKKKRKTELKTKPARVQKKKNEKIQFIILSFYSFYYN